MNDDVLKALAEQQAELDELVRDLDESGWARPSRCEGWTVSDVVLHLAQTNEMAVASVRGEFGDYLATMTAHLTEASSVDDGAAVMVERERSAGAAAIYERWRASVRDLADALGAVDANAKVQWVAGTLAARTLATTRLAETWIHTGDVAFAFGITPPPSGRLWHIARLAWRTLPYAFGREGRTLSGPVAFHLTGPGGEPWDFSPDPVDTASGPAPTVVIGTGYDLCRVASRRVAPSDTGLRADGPDAAAVLELVRTWA